MSSKQEARNKVLIECNESAGKFEKLYRDLNVEVDGFVPENASVEDFLRALFRVFGKKDRFLEFNNICESYFANDKCSSDITPLLAKSYFSIGELQKSKSVLTDFFDASSEAGKIEKIEILCNLSEWACVAEHVNKIDGNKLNKGLYSRFLMVGKRLEKSGFIRSDISARVFCLNLVDDLRKRKIVESVYSKLEAKIEFQEAVNGSLLEEKEVALNNPNGKFWSQLGAIGCFLSHIDAIRKVANGSLENALIIEDDGLPYYRFNDEDVEKAIEGNDIVFINNRMSSLVCGQVEYNGMTTVVERLSMLPDIRKGWGGDGYIISKIGAQKILENFSVDKIIGHFDGQLGSYCVERDASIGTKNKALNIAEIFGKKFKGPNVLVGKTLNFPMVHTVNFSVSSRNIVSQKAT